MDVSIVAKLFGASPDDSVVKDTLRLIEEHLNIDQASSTQADIATYPDISYHNYPPLGLAISYLPPASSAKSDDGKQWLFDRIDFYNPPPGPRPRRRGDKQPWDGYTPPTYPIRFTFPTDTIIVPPKKEGEDSSTTTRPALLQVTTSTSGKDFVACFGEPTKKGGGDNAYVPPFLEWSRIDLSSANSTRRGDAGENIATVGIMVELRTPAPSETSTPVQQGNGGLWDRAAGWPWGSLKVFKPDQ